jgi:hypothetical protein
MRGSLADAAANAMAKGSPRGVAHPYSGASSGSGLAQQAFGQQQGQGQGQGGTGTGSSTSINGTEAAALAKLQVLPPGVTGMGPGAAPTAPIPNQGEPRQQLGCALCLLWLCWRLWLCCVCTWYPPASV